MKKEIELYQLILSKKVGQDVQNNMGAFQGLFGGSNFMIVQNNKMLSDAQIKKHFKMLVSKGYR